MADDRPHDINLGETFVIDFWVEQLIQVIPEYIMYS